MTDLQEKYDALKRDYEQLAVYNRRLIDENKAYHSTVTSAVSDAKDKTGTILLLAKTRKLYGKLKMLSENMGYDTPQQALEDLMRIKEKTP